MIAKETITKFTEDSRKRAELLERWEDRLGAKDEAQWKILCDILRENASEIVYFVEQNKQSPQFINLDALEKQPYFCIFKSIILRNRTTKITFSDGFAHFRQTYNDGDWTGYSMFEEFFYDMEAFKKKVKDLIDCLRQKAVARGQARLLELQQEIDKIQNGNTSH